MSVDSGFEIEVSCVQVQDPGDPEGSIPTLKRLTICLLVFFVFVFVSFCFVYLRQGLHVDQTGLELTETHWPLLPECCDQRLSVFSFL